MYLEYSGCIESTKSWRRDFVVIVCWLFIGHLFVQKYFFDKRKARLVFLSQLLLATFCNECDKSYIVFIGSMRFYLGRIIIDLIRDELCCECFIWKSLILENFTGHLNSFNWLYVISNNCVIYKISELGSCKWTKPAEICCQVLSSLECEILSWDTFFRKL